MKIGSDVLRQRDSYAVRSAAHIISRKRLTRDAVKRSYVNLKKTATFARDRTTLDAIQEMADGLANRLRGTKYQEWSEPMYFEVMEAIRKRDEELRTVHDGKGGRAEFHGVGAGLNKEKDTIPPSDYEN